MLKVIADDKIPFLKGALERYAEVKYVPADSITSNIIKNADALLIRTRTKCTPELLKGSSVKFIGTATIGFDHIDIHYCDSKGIKWINAPGCNSSSVQQYMCAALLKMAQEFRFKLREKTIGIIGVGNVGSKVEKFARLMGMKVLLNDPPRARREGNTCFFGLETLLKESDIISLHVPLTFVGEDQTWHLIDEIAVRKIKNGTWFINTSRGEVADTAIVRKALDSGKFAGAVLDVWENEPDIDIPLMNKAFLATPHIAGYSADGKANGTAMVVNSLAEFFDLPLKNWYPENMPKPENSMVYINCNNKDIEQIIREAVFHTYDITEDDMKLRFAPADFEKQRSEYKMRREFPAYILSLSEGNKDTKDILSGLGFTINIAKG
ncbi:MAG: 4-phosphoerythronate dehydrogenase PdxB [Bacteroidales bacterium]